MKAGAGVVFSQGRSASLPEQLPKEDRACRTLDQARGEWVRNDVHGDFAPDLNGLGNLPVDARLYERR
jgi:hypothetical protein